MSSQEWRNRLREQPEGGRHGLRGMGWATREDRRRQGDDEFDDDPPPPIPPKLFLDDEFDDNPPPPIPPKLFLDDEDYEVGRSKMREYVRNRVQRV